jgi:hypothetical protein
MYETSVMLKHRKTHIVSTHIVSTLFDTINKMSTEEAGASEAGASEAGASEEADACETANKYSVSVPNERFVLNKKKSVLICTYQVRTDGLYPFLMFLLNKKATFIKLDTQKQIKYAALAYMQTILPSVSYAGFCETEENNIIILSAEETNTTVSDYIWVTPFEIMNKKKLMNALVDPLVVAFFLANPDFLFLKDERKRIYESPMVGYKSHDTCGEDEMDIYRETRDPLFGKCYYIDRDPIASPTIMRIAFFAGKMVLKKEKSYDSVLCGDKYIIQNYDQHAVLSGPNKIL